VLPGVGTADSEAGVADTSDVRARRQNPREFSRRRNFCYPMGPTCAGRGTGDMNHMLDRRSTPVARPAVRRWLHAGAAGCAPWSIVCAEIVADILDGLAPGINDPPTYRLAWCLSDLYVEDH